MISKKLCEFENTISKTTENTLKTKYKFLGVRMSELRTLCKIEVTQNPNWINERNFESFEAVMCFGLCIVYAKIDLTDKLKLLKDYLKYVDSWAHIDSVAMTLKIKKSDMTVLWDFVCELSEDKNEFAKRMAVVLCLSKFLNDEYIDRVCSLFDDINKGQFYVDISLAWAYAEMLIKQPKHAILKFKQMTLPKNIQNKAIQKARESFRITNELKQKLLEYKSV